MTQLLTLRRIFFDSLTGVSFLTLTKCRYFFFASFSFDILWIYANCSDSRPPAVTKKNYLLLSSDPVLSDVS